jgi:hypothetical protein
MGSCRSSLRTEGCHRIYLIWLNRVVSITYDPISSADILIMLTPHRPSQIWVRRILCLPPYWFDIRFHNSFIPEFISRLPSMTTLAPLTVPDLRRILTDVRGSLISQYTSLFGYSGVEIRFTSAALNEICKKAAERGGGARGLRGIMVSGFLSL